MRFAVMDRVRCSQSDGVAFGSKTFLEEVFSRQRTFFGPRQKAKSA